MHVQTQKMNIYLEAALKKSLHSFLRILPLILTPLPFLVLSAHSQTLGLLLPFQIMIYSHWSAVEFTKPSPIPLVSFVSLNLESHLAFLTRTLALVNLPMLRHFNTINQIPVSISRVKSLVRKRPLTLRFSHLNHHLPSISTHMPHSIQQLSSFL